MAKTRKYTTRDLGELLNSNLLRMTKLWHFVKLHVIRMSRDMTISNVPQENFGFNTLKMLCVPYSTKLGKSIKNRCV